MNNGMMELQGMEYWSSGVMEYSSHGILEYWNIGALE